MSAPAQRTQVPVSPPAVRLHRPGWRDPRLLVGIVLVAGSVALGSGLVAAAADTVPVYVALEPLVAGDALEPGMLAVREVQLADSLTHYLRADQALPEQPVVVRSISPGELITLSAVASAGELNVRPVAISPSGQLPSGVVKGSSVDLWFVPEQAGRDESVAPELPYQLARQLTVAEVTQATGGLTVGGLTVHVLVPVADLAEVLAALGAGGSVEVVHVPGAAG